VVTLCRTTTCLKLSRVLYSAHTIYLWVSYDAHNKQLLLPYKYQPFKATGYNTVCIKKSSIQTLYILPTKSTYEYVTILTNVTAIFLYVRKTNKLRLFLINLFQLNYRLHFFLNNQPDALFIQSYSVIKFYKFRASSLPIIRSFPLYIRQW
jgi:hypothetical protein